MKKSEVRHREICSAAIAEFSERGYTATSMANIAARAQISRPALYQYFDNKSDIFDSAFVALFEGLAEQAIAALRAEGSLADQLDGFLQRYAGDLWQHMAASPFTDDLVKAKDARLAALLHAVIEPLWHGVDRHLATVPAGSGRGGKRRRAEWVDVLRHGSMGCRSDHPDVDVYRRRLTVLARSIASDVEAESGEANPGASNPGLG